MTALKSEMWKVGNTVSLSIEATIGNILFHACSYYVLSWYFGFLSQSKID